MSLSYPVLGAALAALALSSLTAQRQAEPFMSNDGASRQIAHNMWLYHQAAIMFKAANPATTGILAVIPPSFLTDWRFQSCANAKSVVTAAKGLDTQQNRNTATQLAQQAAAFQSSLVSGIGLSDGTVINAGPASFAPSCVVNAGAAAVQTQVLP